MPNNPTHAQKALLRFFTMGSFEHARKVSAKLHPAEIAELFIQFRRAEQLKFLELILSGQKAGAILSELPEDLTKDLLEEISDDRLAKMIARISPDDAVDLLGYLQEGRINQILEQLSPKERWELERLLLYEEDTAGGIMTTEYIALNHSILIEDAIKQLREKYHTEELSYIYVIDDLNNLIGILPLRQLIFTKTNQILHDVMIPDPIRVQTDTHQKEVARLVSTYDLLAIPVVTADNKLVGVVTVDDIMDVLEEEATADIYHLANLDTDEHVSTPVPRSAGLRIPWLLINLATAILAALTVSLFEKTISQYVALAVMMPIIAGMGGNAGTQSLTVIVRGLALGELDFSTGLPAILKELALGLISGLVNGLVMGLIAYIWYRNFGLAVIMLIAMIANLIIAGAFGAIVPLFLKRFRLDPALGSSIFVTTATDVGGFFVFLGLATLFLHFLIK